MTQITICPLDEVLPLINALYYFVNHVLEHTSVKAMFIPFLLLLTLAPFIMLDTGAPLQPTTLAKNVD